MFDHRDSGTGGHKIVYRAADGPEPVLSGARAITGWQPDADRRWNPRSCETEEFQFKSFRSKSKELTIHRWWRALGSFTSSCS